MAMVALAGFACGLVPALFFWQEAKRRQQALNIMAASFQQEIADRAETEESRKKLEKALLQGQKLQAIGTLAGGIAHDFNNILYAIMGYVEMAEEDLPKESPMSRNLAKVLQGAKRGQELVSRILAFSRRQHHDLQILDLREALEGALDLLRPTIPASVTVQTDFAEGSYPIHGNQTLLHQIMVNLVTNAVDAMEGEGTIHVTLDRIPANHLLLADLPEAPGGYCRIRVSDTGHGMDRATQERIFEPFFTTKEPGRGTGLGLSTVHSLVAEHHGEIMVDSTPLHGTTFTLLLPLHSEITKKGENSYGQNTVG